VTRLAQQEGARGSDFQASVKPFRLGLLSLSARPECRLPRYQVQKSLSRTFCWLRVEPAAIMSVSSTSSQDFDRSDIQLRSWDGPAAVTLVAAVAMIFDALTPQVISVSTAYVGLVLIGYWLP
jgi:hypothetical protein